MNLTPKQIVNELDRYIIGQACAKRAVAVALRNRYRRSQLSAELREEITPKNIIMKGPTGVGKTEIARRLAKLVKAPFVKVEATKYTEVGYVGRDVESMVRDLVEAAIRLVKDEKIAEVEPRAREIAEKKIIDSLLPAKKKSAASEGMSDAELREQLTSELHAGKHDKVSVEIEVDEAPKSIQIGAMGAGGNDNNLGEFLQNMMPKKRKKRKTTVGEALRYCISEEANKLIDMDSVNAEGLMRAEQDGIIFIDEMDKIASKANSHGPDVSREGVQRDILPIVEGCTVSTKYGNLRTDFILFIAAGAFHLSKVSDLIPELQGRFPVLVELQSLTEEDFLRILTEPDNSLIMQYSELFKVDKIYLDFKEDARAEMAKIAFLENENCENIGARRLHTIMEMLLEDVGFNAGQNDVDIHLTIDKDYVQKHLDSTIKQLNLRKYIL
jgi:ATP-dependent HslUV protease ATP-binding subunit HslU